VISRINSAAQIGRLNRVVKRKEAEGFLPTDIAGCKLWLDFSDADTLFTDAGSTKVAIDGDLIYQVNDKSGNGNHMVQATSSQRFKYGINKRVGLSAGVSDSSGQGYSVAIASQSRPRAAFFVIQPTQENSSDFRYGEFGDWFTYGKPNNFKVFSDAWEILQSIKKPYNTWCLISIILNQDILYLRVNGSQISKNTGAGVPTTTSITVGYPYGSHVIGNYAECIFYSGDKLSDYVVIEAYLNDKWDIY
jgi:hypothetical protein